jgi:hypothetical protein
MADLNAPPTLVVQAVSLGLSGVVASQWLGWLPPIVAFIASLFAIAWYSVQLWESRTVKRWRRFQGWNVPVEDEEI